MSEPTVQGIGGPVFFRRDVGGFWDRLVAAVLVPLLFGAWIFAVLGGIGGAVAALGWSLLYTAIGRAMSGRKVPRSILAVINRYAIFGGMVQC